MYSYASLHRYQVSSRPARLVILDVRRNEDDLGVWGASAAPDAGHGRGDATPRPRRRLGHALVTAAGRVRIRSRRTPVLRDLDVRDLDAALR